MAHLFHLPLIPLDGERLGYLNQLKLTLLRFSTLAILCRLNEGMT